MLHNYIKIILRSMLRQKVYSLIKIGGFALGITACVLITLFIIDELGYDKHYVDGERIYRVVLVFNDNGSILGKNVAFPAPFAKALKDEFPEVEQAGRLNRTEYFGAGSNEVRCIDKVQNNHEEGFAFADQDFLDIFQIPMIYGDPHHALDEPGTIVISKRKADKFFPDENPVGKTLIINDDASKQYVIKGVMDNPPVNSHFQSNFLMTLSNGLYPGEQSNWVSQSYDTYIKLRPGTNMEQLVSKFSLITRKYYIPTQQQNGYVDAEKLSDLLRYELQPISDIHLKSEGIQDGLKHGEIRFIWLFAIIAGFILTIACINFINLSTAKSAHKAKEVGFLKTIGAMRSNIVRQFLTESFLFSLISFILGIILAIALLPYFNHLSNKTLAIPWAAWWWILPLILFASGIIGILAGLYPSLYLASFKPADVIKGTLSAGSKSSRIRSALVIFQFTVSIVLIIGTLIIYRQFGYILNKKIGFEKEQVLLLHGTKTMGNKISTFKNELLRLPEVKNVTISDYLPIEGTKRDGNALWKEGKSKVDSPVYGQFWRVDHDYIKTMGMNIVEGRDFSIDMPTDSKAAVINQTLAKELGLTDPILGKKIQNTWHTFEIIGIVQDFNYESLRHNIGGVCLTLGNSPEIVSVKLNTSDMSGTIRSITGIWNKFSVNQSIRYSFLDEEFAMMYTDVQKMGKIFSTFTFLAIIIACLGLFALSSYMIEKRTKEIGIRKVNGAKTSEAITLLNTDFVKWVIIAFIIAIPIAWLAMHRWLENFAYKTSLNWWIFALAGLLAFGIALLTVSWQSWRAATRNPVEALRYE
jgi:putative ABC transport system permease protein